MLRFDKVDPGFEAEYPSIGDPSVAVETSRRQGYLERCNPYFVLLLYLARIGNQPLAIGQAARLRYMAFDPGGHGAPPSLKETADLLHATFQRMDSSIKYVFSKQHVRH